MNRFMLALVLLGCFAATAQAREPSTPTVELEEMPTLTLELNELRLPQYIECTSKGVRYACYTKEQQKKLLAIEMQANNWSRQLVGFIVVHAAESKEIVLLDTQVKIAQENDKAGRVRNRELTTQIMKEIEQKNNWRAKAETPVIWPYVIGGVALAVAGGLVAGAALAK